MSVPHLSDLGFGLEFACYLDLFGLYLCYSTCCEMYRKGVQAIERAGVSFWKLMFDSLGGCCRET